MKRKVFGIGLNKTGTTTLGTCLKQLGYRHLSCRRDLLVALRESRLEEVFSTINDYNSFEDWPYPLMYEELYDRYPGALFILTTRSSPERWIDSLKIHSLHTHPTRQCRKLAYGYDYPHGAEQQHLNFYREHNANVASFFETKNASDRLLLLCWENGDSWEKLCGFLNEPVPALSFPHANRRGTKSEFYAENLRLMEEQLAALQLPGGSEQVAV